MTLQADWYVPDHVHFVKFTGPLRLPDVQEIATISVELVKDYRGKQIHTVADVSQMDKIDISLREMRDVFSTFSGDSLNGWVIIAGSSSPILQFMLSTLGQMFGFKFRMFKTVEEGLLFLNEADPDLPPLLPMRDIFEVTPSPEPAP